MDKAIAYGCGSVPCMVDASCKVQSNAADAELRPAGFNGFSRAAFDNVAEELLVQWSPGTGQAARSQRELSTGRQEGVRSPLLCRCELPARPYKAHISPPSN
ncbi:hypothetical protein EYF80_008141 [Liparis tanakae]|uniref:Uncharacterized protein n=1 Tax=Liparis tanakae TaxID=230148 RepID=A0A4Z2IUT7_9TELE|nr:hypothetical protein EYF80_008141 [Liparis tanakae]